MQDSSKREEWYEHKMRLLKQDKRRRGETIGKLLRCLDDMKDHGKLDETKVTDGRLLLAATVNTRGWSMEDRIYAAVEAMETERGEYRSLYIIYFFFHSVRVNVSYHSCDTPRGGL